MVTFLILFFSALALATKFFSAVFASQQMIFALCSLLIFGFIALALFTKKSWAWLGMFIAILIMVAVEQLAPYENSLRILASLLVAVIATCSIKRPLWKLVKQDQSRTGGPQLKPWMHIALKWA